MQGVIAISDVGPVGPAGSATQFFNTSVTSAA
jgi:hypothetical protein